MSRKKSQPACYGNQLQASSTLANYTRMKTLYITFIALIAFNFSNGQADTAKSKSPEDRIFTFVEESPQFPGGDKELMRFLQQNIHYPEKERANDVEGKVVVRFVVNEDGSVTGVSVIKAVSTGLDNEAVRVVKKLPNFTPGKQQGKKVKVYFNLPIVFKLQDDPTEKKLITAKIQKDSFYKRALGLAKDGTYREAANLAKTSISKFPNEYLGYDLLAECDAKLGRENDACTNYTKAKELGSPNAEAFLSKNCK
jgi:protein TonB